MGADSPMIAAVVPRCAGGNAVRQDGPVARKQHIAEELGHKPCRRHDRDTAAVRQQRQPHARTQRPHQQPGAAAPKARGGAVAQRPGERVAHQRGGRAQREHKSQAVG